MALAKLIFAVVLCTYASALRIDNVKPFECGPENTVWDVGMNNALDTEAYLAEGNCVIAVEASPDLVENAKRRLADHVASGQLRIVGKAISHDSTRGTLDFWLSKTLDEWNSFDQKVACRTSKNETTGKFGFDPFNCYAVHLESIPCEDLFLTYDAPAYMKLDIEGAEKSCLDALQARVQRGEKLPRYVSVEVNPDQPDKALQQLGYTRFKLVRQDTLKTGPRSTSGPWGELALDCQRGREWSTFVEFTARRAKDTEACPWSTWYDVHAMRD